MRCTCKSCTITQIVTTYAREIQAVNLRTPFYSNDLAPKMFIGTISIVCMTWHRNLRNLSRASAVGGRVFHKLKKGVKGKEIYEIGRSRIKEMGVLNLAYYPTLLYNVFRNKLGPTDWPWYSRIDDTVVLGALPFKSMIDDVLIKNEKIAGVVCVTEAHEVENRWAAGKKDFEAKGVKYFWLPIQDFNFNVSLPDVNKAVNFIRQFENTGNSVYVHCKAGRARSAVVVACYLMERHQWYSPAAFAMIKPKRPQINLRHSHWQTIENYSKLYVWGKGKYELKPKFQQTNG